jgi:hypothetical protein
VLVRKCSLNEGVVLRVPGADGQPVLCRVTVSAVGTHPKLMIDAPEGVKIEAITLLPEAKELQRQAAYAKKRNWNGMSKRIANR